MRPASSPWGPFPNSRFAVAEIFDVAVVGAGTMGSQAGLHLARAGLKVLLLDEWQPPHDKGAHHGDTRLYRQAYDAQGSYVPLALESRDGWLALERESGARILHSIGVLNLNPADSPFHQGKKDSARVWGLRVEELGAAQVTARWPGFAVPPDFAGLFELDAGVLDTAVSVRVALAGAVTAGARLVTGAPVTGWEGTGPVTLETAQGSWSANRVLVTAGTSTAGLLAGLALPVRTVRKVVAWFASDARYEAPDFPGFTVNDGVAQYYGFPSFAGSGVKVGRHDGGEDFAPQDQPVAFGTFATDEGDVRGFVQRFLPGAAGTLGRGAACRYDRSPDEDFIIDKVPNVPVWYATGFSGHGFKFAPSLGRHLAGWVAGDERSPLLEPFARRRPGFNALAKASAPRERPKHST